MRLSLITTPVLIALLMTSCGSSNPVGGHGGSGGSAPIFPDCAPDCGPTGDVFFDNSKIAEIRLTYSQSDFDAAVAQLRRGGVEVPLDTWQDVLWANWKVCNPSPIFFPVTMEYKSPDGAGNSILSNVGMRFRGSKSRGANPVAGFKLDFQALRGDVTPRRRFAGENKISALTIEGDSSVMLQCLAYEIMRTYGDVPAPRCNHLKVYVNDVYYAVMQNVEEVDDGRFLKHIFKGSEDNGTLYECSGGCEYPDSLADLEYHGDKFVESTTPGPAAYPIAYNPINIDPATPSAGTTDPAGVAAAEANLIPMFKCGDQTATPDNAAFKACIADWIDVGEWLKVIAAESLMPTVESFLGAKRNFYLYFKPDSTAPHGGRFLIYSWDYDTALVRAACYPTSCDPLTSVAGWYGPAGIRARLATRLTTVFRSEYCVAMNSFLHNAYKPELVDAISQPLDPVIAMAPIPFVDGRSVTGEVIKRDPLTWDVWNAEVLRIRNFITTHGPIAQARVDAICSPGGAP